MTVNAGITIIGGWLLRKAWKIYEKVYQDISQHHVDGKKFGKVKVKVDTSKKDFTDDGKKFITLIK